LGVEANIHTLIIDIGYPQRAHITPNRDFAAAFGCRYVELLRLELTFQELVKTQRTLDQAREALAFELRDLRRSGFSGVKSIAGYRTGLDIQVWPQDETDRAFAAAKAEVAERGEVRLGYKPLLDTLLRDALALAARQNLPAQFHVGYGDPDVDLRLANPVHLRSLIADPSLAGMSFVLLHACWPFFREGACEGAFLATVYPNVFLDLSYAIPFFGFSEYVASTRAALTVSPWTKILFSSDAACIPELHWLGALDGRRAVGQALDNLVADGDLTEGEAMQAAHCILHDNAADLYDCAPRLRHDRS
jgi:predicted TIM-barrel fold metal-dependent hydrolase